MKKLLIIALLIVGCEETGITTNGLTDGTAVIDTLYIFNYDTLIVTNYDTTIFNNYDTLIITNYDTTIVYDTTFAIDTIYIETDDEIFDVDWILLKNTAKQHYYCNCYYFSDTTFVDTGYIFFSNNLSNIELLPPIPQEITPMNTTELVSFDTSVIDLKFRYNDEELIYDISDSKFIFEWEWGDNSYEHIMNLYQTNTFERIILNNKENYIVVFEDDGDGFLINISNSTQILDYR